MMKTEESHRSDLPSIRKPKSILNKFEAAIAEVDMINKYDYNSLIKDFALQEKIRAARAKQLKEIKKVNKQWKNRQQEFVQRGGEMVSQNLKKKIKEIKEKQKKQWLSKKKPKTCRKQEETGGDQGPNGFETTEGG